MNNSSRIKFSKSLTANLAEAERRSKMATPELSQESQVLLEIWALGNRDIESDRVKPVVDVAARLRSKWAAVAN